AKQAWRDQQRLARADAARARAWSRDLRMRLPLLRRHGADVDAARRQILAALPTRAVRFTGFLSDLRDAVPTLRGVRDRVGELLGAPDPVATAEALLAALEARAVALDAAERRSQELAEALE